MKTLELVVYLTHSTLTEVGDTPVYLNKKQIELADTVFKAKFGMRPTEYRNNK